MTWKIGNKAADARDPVKRVGTIVSLSDTLVKIETDSGERFSVPHERLRRPMNKAVRPARPVDFTEGGELSPEILALAAKAKRAREQRLGRAS